jgi:hypothetical protein
LRSTIENSNSDAIYFTGGNVLIDRCLVANNPSGQGVQINQQGTAGPQSFVISNSFFYNNSAAFEILPNFTGTTGVFQFNTVVANNSSFSSCGNVVVQGSIIRGNLFDPDGGLPSLGCANAGSNVESKGDPAPAFVNSSTHDYHLATDTPAHVTTNQACCIDKIGSSFDGGVALPDHDFDGNKRPKGAGWDVGAHEAM